MSAPAYRYAARVERVVDGDTLDVDLDLGMRVHVRTRIRLDGVDTPELRSANPDERRAGEAAREYVRALIATHGDEALVETCRPDKYGRALAAVTLDPTGAAVDLAGRLIADGFGRPYDGGTRA